MLTDSLSEFITEGRDPTFYKFIGKEKAFLFYLKVTFRGRNNFIVRVDDQIQEIAQVSLISALVSGVESGQIKLLWTTNKETPEVEIENEVEGKKPGVAITLPITLYKEIESDFGHQTTLAYNDHLDNPNKHVARSMQDLEMGRIRLRVDPERLKTTKVLKETMTKAYSMWRALP